MLRVAEGGTQEQLNILRTIKQKVIDANIDSNTDSDRAIIQKEINQGYQQIQDIATDTTYNGRHLLLGGVYDHQVFSWEVKDHAVLVEDSDTLGLVKNPTYENLDGQEGKFDIFSSNNTVNVDISLSGSSSSSASPAKPAPFGGFSTLSAGGPRRAPAASTGTTLFSATQTNFSGATLGTSNVYTVDFSGYSDAASLNTVGIEIGNHDYVFTKTPTKNYGYYVVKVDTSSLTSRDQALDALVTSINSYNSIFTAKRNGAAIELSTVQTGKKMNDVDQSPRGISQQASAGSSGTTVPAYADAGSTGAISGTMHLSGGQDQVGTPGGDPNDKDANYVPPKQATLTVDLSGGAQDGKGFTVNGHWYTNAIHFVSGSDPLKEHNRGNNGIYQYTLGADANYTGYLDGMTITYQNHKLTLTANNPGTRGNDYSISDGAKGYPSYTTSGTAAVEAIKKFQGDIKDKKCATDGDKAKYTLDLSSLPDASSPDDVENVIHDLRGKGVQHYYKEYPYSNNPTYSRWTSDSFEFVDSSDPRSLANTARLGGTAVDLSKLRSMVNGTTTVKQALLKLLQDTFRRTRRRLTQAATSSSIATASARMAMPRSCKANKASTARTILISDSG